MSSKVVLLLAGDFVVSCYPHHNSTAALVALLSHTLSYWSIVQVENIGKTKASLGGTRVHGHFFKFRYKIVQVGVFGAFNTVTLSAEGWEVWPPSLNLTNISLHNVDVLASC